MAHEGFQTRGAKEVKRCVGREMQCDIDCDVCARGFVRFPSERLLSGSKTITLTGHGWADVRQSERQPGETVFD